MFWYADFFFNLIIYIISVVPLFLSKSGAKVMQEEDIAKFFGMKMMLRRQKTLVSYRVKVNLRLKPKSWVMVG